MSSNTENLTHGKEISPSEVENSQPPELPEPKLEIEPQLQQALSKVLRKPSQNAMLQEQNIQNPKDNPDLKPGEQIKFNQQNSMQINSRPQNSVRNTLFNPFTNQKTPSCHCKKSKCLKMYCECYAKGIKCRETCKCVGCQNTKNSNRQRKPDSRNDEEIQRSEDSNKKSLKPKERSCNCKKSSCLKKYCECFNANQPCGQTCKCEDCKNNGQNNHFREDKTQGLIPQIDSVFYNVQVSRQISEGFSDGNGAYERKQEQIMVRKRQKPDEDEIQTKISQILKLVPPQNYQTMLDFLAYYLS